MTGTEVIDAAASTMTKQASFVMTACPRIPEINNPVVVHKDQKSGKWCVHGPTHVLAIGYSVPSSGSFAPEEYRTWALVTIQRPTWVPANHVFYEAKAEAAEFVGELNRQNGQ